MAKKSFSNENPIDKLFREGMEQRQFVYEEKHWEDAQKVLSEFNRAADKKRYGWWFGGGIAVVLLVSALLFLRPDNAEQTLAVHTPARQEQSGDQAIPEIAHTAQDGSDEASSIPASDAGAIPTISSNNTNQSSTNDQTSTPVSTQNAATHNTSDVAPPPANDASRADQNPSDQTDPAVSENVQPEDQTEISVEPVMDHAIDGNNDVVQEDPGVINALTQGALPPKNFNTTRVQWYAGMYAGTQRSYAQFGTGPAQWLNYVESKQGAAFSPTISLEAGLRVKPYPIDINLGVNFMQMGEDAVFAVNQISFDTSFTIDTYLEPIIDTFYIDTTMFIDTNYIEITDTTWVYNAYDSTVVRQASNRLYYAEIPMLFGYSYQYKKWSFRLSTGPSIGILHKRAGYYPNDDLTDFNPLEELDYFNDIVWYWRLDPAIGYALSPSVVLQCRGTLRAQISDTYQSDDRSLRYVTHGLQVGLRYTFTGK